METNKQKLEAALAFALADEDFMGNNKKVDNAVDALTPKDTLTATFKRLQGNARKDFLDKKDQGLTGYVDEAKDAKIRDYVHAKFQAYMENPKTAKKATELFFAAYPSKEAEPVTAE